MRRTVATLIALVSAVAASPVATAANRTPDRPGVAEMASSRYEAGRVLVGVDPGKRAVVRGLVRQHGGHVEELQAPGGLFVVDVPGNAPAWAGALRGGQGVRYAEPDYLVATQDIAPDDPRWGSQWDMRTIDAPAA
jgi:Fervidolysin N-terminal prodomain